MNEILIFHYACALFMTGLIWFVQIVHYPMILDVPQSDRLRYCRIHAKRTTFIVLPVMLLESATAIYLHFVQQPSLFWLCNLLLLVGIWASTLFIQVPIHRRLAERTDNQLVKQLVRGNWIRTLLWSLRSLLLSLWILGILLGMS